MSRVWMFGTTADTAPHPAAQHREVRLGLVTVYVITDVTSRQASPESFVTILRAHWKIRNWLHSPGTPHFEKALSRSIPDTDGKH